MVADSGVMRPVLSWNGSFAIPRETSAKMRFRKDKRDLFETVALPHLDALYRFAFHLCGNESDAEDLTQESFHLAYRKFHQFRQGTNCRAWLFRIVRNAHIDRLRQKAREPRSTEFQEALQAGVAGAPERPLESDLLKWHKLAVDGEDAFYELFGDEVNRHLSELPPEFRLSVVLCDVEGFSYSEISGILGCPVGTVRSRISRARSILKEKLYEYASGLGFVKESPFAEKDADKQ